MYVVEVLMQGTRSDSYRLIYGNSRQSSNSLGPILPFTTEKKWHGQLTVPFSRLHYYVFACIALLHN